MELRKLAEKIVMKKYKDYPVISLDKAIDAMLSFHEQASKDMVDKKFLLWLADEHYYVYDEQRKTWKTDEPTAFSEEYTLDELFTFWKDNIQDNEIT